MLHPAAFGESFGEGKVRCTLCPTECILTEGKRGICVRRFNSGGQLVTDNYGEAVTLATDPIEKKPLYHFYPGRTIVSTGPNCCNLSCSFCQNWAISQEEAPTRYLSPEELVRIAREEHSLGVAFTYSEPVIWYEYILDTAPLLHEIGLKVVLVTNGYINGDPLKELLPHVDAFNVDLKGMSERFYSHFCKGKLTPVLDAIRMIAQSPAHLEITNLVIPDENDSDADIGALVEFVASVSPNIPLHFSAYHPDYRMKNPRTPEATLVRAARIARRNLSYVYLGNIQAHEENNTYCPTCRYLLIERSGYRATIRGLNGDRCAGCDAPGGIRV
jgi:pyruvate formate lyase activating enzyme